jgi:predicted RNase H-like HicB family nuclease
MATASMVEFQKNRPRFPWEELLKYNGNWVAFNADGTRIVAHGKTLEDLFEVLKAANEDVHEVVYEKVEFEPFVSNLGAAEFQ